jgi:hypothetical protein
MELAIFIGIFVFLNTLEDSLPMLKITSSLMTCFCDERLRELIELVSCSFVVGYNISFLMFGDLQCVFN